MFNLLTRHTNEDVVLKSKTYLRSVNALLCFAQLEQGESTNLLSAHILILKSKETFQIYCHYKQFMLGKRRHTSQLQPFIQQMLVKDKCTLRPESKQIPPKLWK